MSTMYDINDIYPDTGVYQDTDSIRIIKAMTPTEVEMMVKVWQSIKHTVNGADLNRDGGFTFVDDSAARFNAVREMVENLPNYLFSKHRDPNGRGYKRRSRAGAVRMIRKDLDEVRAWAEAWPENAGGQKWVRLLLEEIDEVSGYLPHNAEGHMDDEDSLFYIDASKRMLDYLDELKLEM